MKVISRVDAKAQGLKHYFTGKPCSRGHIGKRFVSSFACVACAKMHCQKAQQEHPGMFREASKKYRAKNPEKVRAGVKKWRRENQDKVKAIKKRERENNKESCRRRSKRWYENNRDLAIQRARESRLRRPEEVKAYFRKYRKERMANDPDFRMRMMCSVMLRRVLLTTGQKKENNTEKTVGYSGPELRNHLERNMSADMNWDNYGALWEIDHVIPVMEMIRQGVKDPAKINAISNLMPEYKDKNQSKGDRFALSPPPVL